MFSLGGLTQHHLPGLRMFTTVTFSLSLRWSHGLKTSFPSPSLLSFRHCIFSTSIRPYRSSSRPRSGGSCSPAQPQPRPCPCPWPWPDIVELKVASNVSQNSWQHGETAVFYTLKWYQQVSLCAVKQRQWRQNLNWTSTEKITISGWKYTWREPNIESRLVYFEREGRVPVFYLLRFYGNLMVLLNKTPTRDVASLLLSPNVKNVVNSLLTKPNKNY